MSQVGITMARLRRNAKVILSDLAEAREIVLKNLAQAQQGNVSFTELDWEVNMEHTIPKSDTNVDLVIATDCTYNPDSR